jgi:aminocarboxymuconate-semialdehyde decarboxylase
MAGSSTENRNTERRAFLKGLGGVAAAAAGLAPNAAQTQTAAPPLKVIDFHNHHVGAAFTSMAGAGAPPAMRSYFQEVNRNLADPQALLASIESAGIAARVVNTPLEFIQDAEGDVAPDTITRINDQLAELVRRNSGRVHALATVDPYSGDAGARELTRAVRELGLRGVFVQAVKNDLSLDSPQARPTLAAAAALGVPVFIHPITDSQLRRRFPRLGRPGTMLNRSMVNSAALLALLEGNAFEELPDLRVVVTTLAIGTVLISGGFGHSGGLRRGPAEVLRRHVYIDTMGLHPVLIRAAIDMLGVEHVLAGTDWPIFAEKDIPQRLHKALTLCGLDAADQEKIAGGNTAKLLGVS